MNLTFRDFLFLIIDDCADEEEGTFAKIFSHKDLIPDTSDAVEIQDKLIQYSAAPHLLQLFHKLYFKYLLTLAALKVSAEDV